MMMDKMRLRIDHEHGDDDEGSRCFVNMEFALKELLAAAAVRDAGGEDLVSASKTKLDRVMEVVKLLKARRLDGG